jgi:hypothetical protein
MPGFDTGSVMYALNVDFTGNSLTAGTAQVTSNGQLMIGSTALPNIKIGTLTSPDGSITIGYSSPNITLQNTGGQGLTKIGVDTTTGGGTNPVLPTVGGLITYTGGQYATGSFGTRVLTINSPAPNTVDVEVQISSAVSATNLNKNGVSHFDSAAFLVDANGFVQSNSTASAQLVAAADGTYVIAANNTSNTFSGTFYLELKETGRTQTMVLTAAGSLLDNYGNVSILSNQAFLNQAVMTNLRIATDNNGDTVLLVDVGNRNGQTIHINIAWVGVSQALPRLVPIAAPPYVTQTYAGLDQLSRQEVVASYRDTATTAVTTALSVAHYMATGNSAGNNIGVQMNFDTMVNNGTAFIAANMYTKTPNASTNVQTSNFAIQTNNAGSLADSFTLTGAGVPAFPQAPLGITSGGSNATSFTQSNGVVTYNGTRLVNYAGPQIASTGVATNTAQPAFNAYKSAVTTNATGDGTQYVVIFDTVIFDQASNYNSGTGLFTAPVTGKYQFNVNLTISTFSSSHTDYTIFFITNTAFGSPAVYWTNPYISQGAAGFVSASGSALLALTAGQTVSVVAQVQNGAKTVSVYGAANLTCNFSGNLVC